MNALEQLWNGVSPCMEPGVTDCVVWWDAWAVVVGASGVGVAVGALIVAWVGVGVTTASAFAVWKLGIAANAASAEATRIAASEAERSERESGRREYRDETEELLVLVQVTGEIAIGIEILNNVVGALSDVNGKDLFLGHERQRKAIIYDLERVSFEMVSASRERMHYLDREVAGCLLRATGLMKYVQDTYRSLGDVGTGVLKEDVYDVLAYLLPLVRDDLEKVKVACEWAAKRTGIANADIAQAAKEFGASR